MLRGEFKIPYSCASYVYIVTIVRRPEFENTVCFFAIHIESYRQFLIKWNAKDVPKWKNRWRCCILMTSERCPV